MTRRERLILVILGTLLLAAVTLELLAPTPIDWTKSFMAEDERPFGARLLRGLLPSVVPGQSVAEVPLPPFVWLRGAGAGADADTERPRTYFFLTDRFSPDPVETEALVAFAEEGHTLFVGAHEIEGTLADTLGLGFDAYYGSFFDPNDRGSDSLTIDLVNPSLRMATAPRYGDGTVTTFLDHVDTLRTTILGRDSGGGVNYVRIAVGRGAVLVHTVPLAFTNYHLRDDALAEYAFRALAYLPEQPIWWDGYYKPPVRQATTPLRYILLSPSLRWAFRLAVAGVVLFIFFGGRRRQRVVPVIAPRRNTTLAFVETVGQVYYQHGDHADLAHKKITYFLEDVRSRLQISTARLDEAFVDRVARKSGVPRDVVARTVGEIVRFQSAKAVSVEAVMALSHAIEAFHARRVR